MQTLQELHQSSEIRRLLAESQTIAVVGLSPKENRASNMVARYLIDSGYTIYPVNPGQNEILGQACYSSVSAIPHAIDIVDIFRKPEDVLPIVEEIVGMEKLPKAIWMQQGIINEKAAELARSSGISVIMDRCIKVDHSQFLRN